MLDFLQLHLDHFFTCLVLILIFTCFSLFFVNVLVTQHNSSLLFLTSFSSIFLCISVLVCTQLFPVVFDSIFFNLLSHLCSQVVQFVTHSTHNNLITLRKTVSCSHLFFVDFFSFFIAKSMFFFLF